MNKPSCNSCESTPAVLPVEVFNRPGLNAVRYRIGEYGDFLQSLSEKLSLSKNLKGLAARDNNDFSIALSDAWSVAADVFTFYQERIANESWLRTATERFSVLELARLVGYELKPGVAASTYIAFTLEEAKITLDSKAPTIHASNLYGGAQPVTIEKGIKIQSIPEKDQLQQIFETSETIEARTEWNHIRPQQSFQQEPLNESVVYIKGTNNNIRKGDSLLIATKEGELKLKSVLDLLIDDEMNITQLNLNSASTTTTPPIVPTEFCTGSIMYKAQFNNSISDKIRANTITQQNLNLIKRVNKWTDLEIKTGLNSPAPPPENTQVYVFRKKVPVFGYNAQMKTTITDGRTSQTEYTLEETAVIVQLDNAYDQVLEDSYIAIQNADKKPSFYKVENANTGVLTRYGISSKTTTLKIIPANIASKKQWWGSGEGLNQIRNAMVFAQSEPLALSSVPDESPVGGDSIVLDQYYPGLKENQPVSLSGEKIDLPGMLYYEIAIIKTVQIISGKTKLTFVESLQNQYIRKTVFINANVALATHGETVQEVLGNGDSSKTFQKFRLKQPPLTYVGAATASGHQSTLQIRVNDILWHETDYFYGHTGEEQIYITRIDNEGNTTVIFGDGKNGARLPTGNHNIVATYRKGTGSEGLMKAKQLSQLITKPLEVKSAINPIPSSGFEDPETIDDAKRNATLNILTLNRIVSLKDYEDFATAFSGIAKANAIWARRLNKQQIFLTVAGEDGAEVKASSILYQNLIEALLNAGINRCPLNVSTYTPAFFDIEAGLKIHTDYTSRLVLENAEKRLLEKFSFNKRDFMQPVSYSEVVTCIQETPGVSAVDIDALYRSEAAQPTIEYLLLASAPTVTNNIFLGAELLTIAQEGIKLKILL